MPPACPHHAGFDFTFSHQPYLYSDANGDIFFGCITARKKQQATKHRPKLNSAWRRISVTRQPPVWVPRIHARNGALMTCCWCSPCSTRRAFRGLQGLATLGVHRRKSLVWADKLTYNIKACSSVSVTAKERDSEGSPSRGGDVTVYVEDTSQSSLSTPFYSVFVSVSLLWPFHLYFIP